MSYPGHHDAATHVAAALTAAGSTGTLVAWGLHLNEVLAIISTMCALVGVGLNVYIVFFRHRKPH